MLGVVVVAFGVTSLIAPKFLANIFDGVGGYSASIFFYEKQYEKTEDIYDLVLLVDKIEKEKDSVLAEEYLYKLINHEQFNEYCNLSDGKGFLNTKEYYSGLYALSLCKNRTIEEAMNFASEFVAINGYTIDNPFRVLISEYIGSGADQTLTIIKEKIQEKLSSFSGEQLIFATNDIKEIQDILIK